MTPKQTRKRKEGEKNPKVRSERDMETEISSWEEQDEYKNDSNA